MDVNHVNFWVNFEEEMMIAERSGLQIEVLKKHGIVTSGGGFVDSAEGIRIPFNREKAQKRAETMKLLADVGVTVDRILSDDPGQDTTD